MNTKLVLKPGEKGRLTVGSNVALDESSIKWSANGGEVGQIDLSKSRTPFDVVFVAGAIAGTVYVEFSALDAEGNNREHLFEINVTEKDGDSDLFGSARVSRESFEATASAVEVPETPAELPTDEPAVADAPPSPFEIPTSEPALMETPTPLAPVADTDGADAAVATAGAPVVAETDGAGDAPSGTTETESESPVAETDGAIVATDGKMAGFVEDDKVNSEVETASETLPESTEAAAEEAVLAETVEETAAEESATVESSEDVPASAEVEQPLPDAPNAPIGGVTEPVKSDGFEG